MQVRRLSSHYRCAGSRVSCIGQNDALLGLVCSGLSPSQIGSGAWAPACDLRAMAADPEERWAGLGGLNAGDDLPKDADRPGGADSGHDDGSSSGGGTCTGLGGGRAMVRGADKGGVSGRSSATWANGVRAIRSPNGRSRMTRRNTGGMKEALGGQSPMTQRSTGGTMAAFGMVALPQGLETMPAATLMTGKYWQDPWAAAAFGMNRKRENDSESEGNCGEILRATAKPGGVWYPVPAKESYAAAVSAGGIGRNPGGQSTGPEPGLFYAKRIFNEVENLLTADELRVESFLGWWKGSNCSRDFWIETPPRSLLQDPPHPEEA